MRRLIRLLWYVRPYWLQLFSSVVLMATVGALEAFRLLLFRPIFDRVLKPESPPGDIVLFSLPEKFGGQTIYLQQFVPSHFHNAWTIVAYSLIMATLIKGVCDYLGTYLVNYAGFGLITDMRNDLYSSLMRRSAAFFQKHPTGMLVSAVINDVEKIQTAMTIVLADFLQQLFTLIFLVGAVIVTGKQLAWVLLVFVPVILASARRVGRSVRKTTRTGLDKLAEIQNILHETITGNRIVKAFGMELFEVLRFKGAARKLFKANLRSVKAQAITSPLMDVLGSIAIALLLLVGRDRINHGQATEGMFVAFIFVTFRLYDPVRKFAGIYNSFQQSLAASDSVFKFMDFVDEVHEKPLARKLPPFREGVRFENVQFSYRDEVNAPLVLRDINLEAKAGEVLAIVGSSGSGKSTLVHLIPRFFDVTAGSVLIDGHDVRDVSLHSLRAQVGIVTQETVLFNDTVRNNIAYGQPDVSQEQVQAAARAALAHEFIARMPQGYDTVIGERGFRLSGGERQRLSIARAILKNAPILILDEATSALDTESEHLVQTALENLMQNRTVFVIAHRLSTVRRADRILVLDNGRIVDAGTHEDLLSRLGPYRRLYDMQFVQLDPPSPVPVAGASGKGAKE
ncbi:MAG TPA: ABC transporter transmembrane domain-containing protein [Candidatus Acidoferrales bacterium]|nr:ABC transporter transmembrane domain-containing protein [Candidatus Acidoferrales bacterium]